MCSRVCEFESFCAKSVVVRASVARRGSRVVRGLCEGRSRVSCECSRATKPKWCEELCGVRGSCASVVPRRAKCGGATILSRASVRSREVGATVSVVRVGVVRVCGVVFDSGGRSPEFFCRRDLAV